MSRNFADFVVLSSVNATALQEVKDIEDGFDSFAGTKSFLKAFGSHALSNKKPHTTEDMMMSIPEGGIGRLENGFFILKNQDRYHAFQASYSQQIDNETFKEYKTIATKDSADLSEKQSSTKKYLEKINLIKTVPFNKEDLVNFIHSILKEDPYLSSSFLELNDNKPTKTYLKTLSFENLVTQVQKTKEKSNTQTRLPDDWEDIKNYFTETMRHAPFFNKKNYKGEEEGLTELASPATRSLARSVEALVKDKKSVPTLQSRISPLEFLDYVEDIRMRGKKISDEAQKALTAFGLGVHNKELEEYGNKNHPSLVSMRCTKKFSARSQSEVIEWATKEKLEDKRALEKALKYSKKDLDTLGLSLDRELKVKDFGTKEEIGAMLRYVNGLEEMRDKSSTFNVFIPDKTLKVDKGFDAVAEIDF